MLITTSTSHGNSIRIVKNWRSQGVFVPEVFQELVYTTDSEGNLWNSGNYVETKNNTKNPNPCSIY